jgi:exosortase A
VSLEQNQHAWRIAGLTVAMLLLLVLGLYQQTVVYLTWLWNGTEISTYTHGYLVIVISGFLILRSRRSLLFLTPCPEYRALAAVLAASMLWMVATLVDVQMMQTVGLLLLVLAVVWTVLGNQVIRVLLFPILFIGFAIPIWFPLFPVLQNLTTDAVFWLIRIIEVPALRREHLIILPAGSLSIEESCSGLHYLLAALTLGALYAYLNYSSFRARLAVVCVSAGAALLANILRVFIVVYLGYATEMQHPLIHDHVMLGWYLYGGLVAVLLFVDARLYRHHASAVTTGTTNQHIVASGGCRNGAMRYLSIVIVCVPLLSAEPAVVYWLERQEQMDSASITLKLPVGTSGWTGPAASHNDWMPLYHGAVTLKQDYVKDSARVTLYIGYYPSQRQGDELINDLNQINNRDIWRTRHDHPGLRQAGDQLVLENVLENNDGAQQLIWYWYRVAGRSTTNKYIAKMLQVLGLLSGNSQTAIVAVATKTDEDTERARRILGEYVSAMEPELVKIVTESRRDSVVGVK